MPTVSRLTLPSEFTNPVNAALLIQPQPQFFFAGLLYQASAAAELKQGIASVGPNPSRVFSSSGAPVPDLGAMQLDLTNPEMAASVMLRGEAIKSVQFPLGRPNEVVTMMRPNFVDSTYTEASRDTTRKSISTTAQNILGNDAVSLTIKEASGPYSNADADVRPLGLEGFDLDMSPTHNLIEYASLHLRRDRTKYLDAVVSARFFNAVQSTNYIYPGDPRSALSTDNSAFAVAGDRRVDIEALSRGVKRLKDLGIPTFSNGRYMAVLSTQQVLDLKSSSNYRLQAKYFPEKNPLFTGYVSTVDNLDIFECSTNPTATANSTITVQLGVLFGPGAIGYGLAKPVGVVAADDTNFGRRVNVIWTTWEGFATFDDRFVVSLRSD